MFLLAPLKAFDTATLLRRDNATSETAPTGVPPSNGVVVPAGSMADTMGEKAPAPVFVGLKSSVT